MKRGLSARDARLQSYRVAGSSRDGAQQATYTFAYRAPQKMRAALTEPVTRTFSFDGRQLYERNDADRLFHAFDNQLSPARSAGFLTQTFSPFIPEGFRVPLMPRRGVTLARARHALAAQALELTVPVVVSGSESLALTYVLRWPSLDFLGKRTRGSSGELSEVRVEQEHCDAALKLCVPSVLSRWQGTERVGETRLTRVELNPALPEQDFTLAAPQGYTVRRQTLTDAPVPEDAGSP